MGAGFTYMNDLTVIQASQVCSLTIYTQSHPLFWDYSYKIDQYNRSKIYWRVIVWTIKDVYKCKEIFEINLN